MIKIKQLSLFIATTFILLHIKSVCISPNDAEKISKEAYIYGYPLVLMEETQKIVSKKAPVNQFFHLRKFPTDKFTDIVRPNVDTLYSSAWLDLTESPIILTLPDTHNRYYLMEVLDSWTNVFASLGKRTTGTKAKEFAIVGPEWKGNLPKQYTVIKAPTNLVWILGRTQTNGKSDYKFVHKIQDGYKLKVLNPTNKKSSTSFLSKILWHKVVPPAQQVAQMDAKTFFTNFAQELQNNPPQKIDQPILDRLKKIGIEQGKDFDFDNLPKQIADALDKGIEEAKKEIALKAKKFGKRVNGWQILKNIGVYSDDYTTRAIIAMIGIGANIPEDAIYPTTFLDAEGKQLDGNNKYVIHFDKKDIPPVNAFWSVTMYNSKSYLTPNSINRYGLGDRDNLQFNKDGSLDLYIQHDKPENSKVSNWLPAPKENFNLTLRLYWPKQAILNGTWTPPAIINTSKK